MPRRAGDAPGSRRRACFATPTAAGRIYREGPERWALAVSKGMGGARRLARPNHLRVSTTGRAKGIAPALSPDDSATPSEEHWGVHHNGADGSVSAGPARPRENNTWPPMGSQATNDADGRGPI